MKKIQQCMDTIPQGVFIVGTQMGDTYNLMTAAFVMQVSFNPCSLAVSVANAHYTAELVSQQGRFSLSVLAEGQEAEAKACGFQSGRRTDKSQKVSYRLEEGLPVIEGAASYMICQVKQTVVFEDHTIFLAEILSGDFTEARPMIYDSKEFF